MSSGKIVLIATATLIFQVFLVLFSLDYIDSDGATNGEIQIHTALIVMNVIFGILNIKTIFTA